MIKDYVNALYDDNLEMIAIIDAIQPELDAYRTKIRHYFEDTFPNIATLNGIEHWENLLGIIADPIDETLDFRRERILARLISNIPYTERMLIETMDNILGKYSWYYTLDYNNYMLDINSVNYGKNWTREVEVILGKIIPANLVYKLTIKQNTHQELSSYTHEYLSKYTHLQLNQEGIG